MIVTSERDVCCQSDMDTHILHLKLVHAGWKSHCKIYPPHTFMSFKSFVQKELC